MRSIGLTMLLTNHRHPWPWIGREPAAPLEWRKISEPSQIE